MKSPKKLIIIIMTVASAGCVNEKADTITGISMDYATLELSKGETMKLTVKTIPDGLDAGNISWTSSAEATAAVDMEGNVTGLKTGEAIITAVSSLGFETGCAVTVTGISVEGILMTPDHIDMTEGETAVIKAEIVPANADIQSVIWLSSDENVATVDMDGTVHGISAGNAVITAKAEEITAECTITVSAPLAEPGFWYYADGTWSKELNREKNPVGIVFWTGNPAIHDTLLGKDHPSCTHGLAVSLYEGENRMPWQENYTGYDATVSNWISANTDYEVIVSGYDGSGKDLLNKMMGYNNTKAIQAFNTAPENSTWTVGAIESVAEYNRQHPAPESSSGWYLPSAKEASLLCTGNYEGNIWSITDGVSIRDMVNSKLSELRAGTALSNWDYYWTSTEVDKEYVYVVYFSNGAIYGPWNFSKNTTDVVTCLRYILAF